MPQMIAVVPELGGYFSIFKIVIFLLLVVPWLYLAPKVYHDAKRVHASQSTWSAATLVAGLLGVILWLVLPIYILGLVAYLLVAGGAIAAYVVFRNGRVPHESRILTRQHIAGLLARKKQAVTVISRVKLYGHNGKLVPPPDAQESLPDQIESNNLLQELLHEMISRRASEVTLSPAGSEMTVRLLIDGVATPRDPLLLSEGQMMIQFLKPFSGLDPSEVRRPQKGDFSVDMGSRRIDIAVSTAGTTGGQQVQFRIAQEVVRQKLDTLGMTEDVLKAVRFMNKTIGLIIVSGRPGSGITSTMYSLLREQDAFTKQLVTLEKHPALALENITQTPYTDARLADALAPVVRRDPDVLMIDECTDADSARLIMEAAADKTVILGMNAEDTLTALAKWVKLCGDASAAVANLQGVMCQMLLRKLCVDCREPYQPDPQLLAKANLPAGQIEKFYRPPTQQARDEKGNPVICRTCQGVGYFERTGAFEFMQLTPELRQLIGSGASLRDIKSACRKNKMLYLQEQALRKVISGVTSIQEVLRASAQPKK